MPFLLNAKQLGSRKYKKLRGLSEYEGCYNFMFGIKFLMFA
jgi:hypothetical protein